MTATLTTFELLGLGALTVLVLNAMQAIWDRQGWVGWSQVPLKLGVLTISVAVFAQTENGAYIALAGAAMTFAALLAFSRRAGR